MIYRHRENAIYTQGTPMTTGAKRGMEQPSGSPNPTDLLMLDFQPPVLEDNKFLSFKPPSLWLYIKATLRN